MQENNSPWYSLSKIDGDGLCFEVSNEIHAVIPPQYVKYHGSLGKIDVNGLPQPAYLIAQRVGSITNTKNWQINVFIPDTDKAYLIPQYVQCTADQALTILYEEEAKSAALNQFIKENGYDATAIEPTDILDAWAENLKQTQRFSDSKLGAHIMAYYTQSRELEKLANTCYALEKLLYN